MNDPYKLLVLHCVDAAAAEYISGRMNMQEAVEYGMQMVDKYAETDGKPARQMPLQVLPTIPGSRIPSSLPWLSHPLSIRVPSSLPVFAVWQVSWLLFSLSLSAFVPHSFPLQGKAGSSQTDNGQK